jgi:hypothetical protein
LNNDFTRLCTQIALNCPVNANAETFVRLIEELVDLKVHQRVEPHLHAKPELARMLEEKRSSDRRRLEMIKLELTRLLS